ncbi:hypothetical protein [Georgenia daeguensis]|uniref:Uncharacterized protein n=1 Tax=Georgenia daeguensis TaxID=908355 RepID=A0ABP8EYN1_9MICO
MVSIDTTPETEAMARARAALFALNERPDDIGAQAAGALFALNSVHPPYPPARPLPAGEVPTIEQARELLIAAAEASTDVPELGRIALAGDALNTPIVR